MVEAKKDSMIHNTDIVKRVKGIPLAQNINILKTIHSKINTNKI